MGKELYRKYIVSDISNYLSWPMVGVPLGVIGTSVIGGALGL
jgi:hypothetical protein